MVAFISSSLSLSFSLCVHIVGNLPALLSPGPRRRGICLIKASEATKASYFLAVDELQKEFSQTGRGLYTISNVIGWSEWAEYIQHVVSADTQIIMKRGMYTWGARKVEVECGYIKEYCCECKKKNILPTIIQVYVQHLQAIAMSVEWKPIYCPTRTPQ